MPYSNHGVGLSKKRKNYGVGHMIVVLFKISRSQIKDSLPSQLSGEGRFKTYILLKTQKIQFDLNVIGNMYNNNNSLSHV